MDKQAVFWYNSTTLEGIATLEGFVIDVDFTELYSLQVSLKYWSMVGDKLMLYILSMPLSLLKDSHLFPS